MRSSQRPLALWAALAAFLIAFGAPCLFADALDDAAAQASALFDQGAYAQARALLEKALAQTGLAPDSAGVRKAQALLARVDDAAEDAYRAQLAAVAKAEKAAKKNDEERQAMIARHQAMENQASALIKEAETQGKPEKYMEAARLRSRVAEERAMDAYNRAMDFYEQGDFDKARAGFEQIKKFVASAEKLDPAVRPDIGAARVEQVEKYLGRIEQAKANAALGRQVYQQRLADRRKQDEAERKYREALALFNAAVLAFDRGQFLEAKQGFEAVRASGADLGAARRAEVDSYLQRIAAQERLAGERRAVALQNMKTGESMLNRGEWKGAAEFLHKARADMDLLTPQERNRLAGLLKQAHDEELARLHLPTTPEGIPETERRLAERYMEEVRKQHEVLKQQNQALADQYAAIADSQYKDLRYQEALQNAENALKYVGDHPQALKLRAELRALLGLDKGLPPTITELSGRKRARIEQVRSEMNLAVSRGRLALDAKNYDEALKQFNLAAETLEYLRPDFDVRNDEALLKKLTADARAGKEAAEKQLAMRKEFEAKTAAEQALIEQRDRERQQITALFTQANTEFARKKYAAAIEAAEAVLERDPNHLAARELIDQAQTMIRRRNWINIYETDRKNRMRESQELRAKLIWPGAEIEYPAREVWQMIKERVGVDAVPPAAVTRTPEGQRHEKALDEKIEGFSFDESPLDEVINFFKLLPQFERINFVIDRTALGDTEVFVTLTMNNVTLRQALKAILTPKKLDFIIANDAIYISNAEGIAKVEGTSEDLYYYQYDVHDLLISSQSFSGGGGNGGGRGRGSSGRRGGTTSNGSSTSGNNGGAASSEEQELIDLIQLFTGGPPQWDLIGAISSSTDTGNGNATTTGNNGATTGTTGIDLAAAFAEGRPLNRIALLRQGYLMVQHVDRIHKIIQLLLERLRAQTTIQVRVEGRYLTFSDQFYKDVGIQWQNLSWDVGRKLGIPGSTWTISAYNPISAGESFGLASTLLNLNVAFMNSSQTQAIITAAKNSRHATTVNAIHVTVRNTEWQDFSFEINSTYISGYDVRDGVVIPQRDEYSPSSTEISVRPVVSADRRYVTMDVFLDASTEVLNEPDLIPIIIRPTGNGAVGNNAPSTIVPVFSTTESQNNISSSVRVPDRGTFVLGGLADVRETTGQGSIPVLGHIPILKRLVTRDAVGKQRVHNIFLVTPTILLQEEIEP